MLAPGIVQYSSGSTIYATFDPLKGGTIGASNVLSGGNLTATLPNGNRSVLSTLGKTSGKWYWEIKVANSVITDKGSIGVATTGASPYTSSLGSNAYGWAMIANTTTNQSKIHSGSGAAFHDTPPNLSAGQTIGVVLNMDPVSGPNPDGYSISIYKYDPAFPLLGNVLQGIMYPAGTFSGLQVFAAVSTFSNGSLAYTANFGATAFNSNVDIAATRASLVTAGFNMGLYV